MNIRNSLLLALRKELMGPRNGPNEVIANSPLSEYITGILEPKNLCRNSFVDEVEVAELKPVDVDYGEEDDEFDYEQLVPPPISSAVDPRSLPKSMGISFTVSGLKPTISICLTYGTYKKVAMGYERTSHNEEIPNVVLDFQNRILYQDSFVTLSCRTKKIRKNLHVILYLVNTIEIEQTRFYGKIDEHVFQPQIRIKCVNDTKPEPVEGKRFFNEDEGQLRLLFLNKRAYARGHMCSATWQNLDPERPFGTETLEDNPYPWVDGQVLPVKIRKYYTHPDLRTEFIPVHLIEQVSMKSNIEDTSFFSAEELSESWNFESLEKRLQVIVDGYSKWIDIQETKSRKLPKKMAKIAELNIENCRIVLERIRDGITSLKLTEVRLCFCFMNKVMSLQHRWKTQSKRPSFNWYPFQIAFILSCIPSIIDINHPDRKVCEILWFPTGGGKTEAYLGLSIFTMAYRRRMHIESNPYGYGTAVISRYTLRLLTVQQFRRTLGCITACEYLRVKNWVPKFAGEFDKKFLWGLSRFSVGLWVGANVTPNRVAVDYGNVLSAITSLERGGGFSEPAQISNCPVCDSILALSETADTLHGIDLYLYGEAKNAPPKTVTFPQTDIRIIDYEFKHVKGDYYSIRLRIQSDRNVDDVVVDDWWEKEIAPLLGINNLLSARASRPGYFIMKPYGTRKGSNFEIRCPKPSCELNNELWYELEPWQHGPRSRLVHDFFRTQTSKPIIDKRYSFLKRLILEKGIPIPAYTCDDQIYHRLPTMIIATVDKFARLPFEARAASLFGNVDTFDEVWGFHRNDISPRKNQRINYSSISIDAPPPPELVIQDELHLINGPLGSMFGLYESAIESLLIYKANGSTIRPKYIASSATIRHAKNQVESLFNRTICEFPPNAIDISDRFFSKEIESHPVTSKRPGRVYVGVCAPGKGSQTPAIRIWATLLQEAFALSLDPNVNPVEADQFLTHVGYFNAIKELAIIRSRYRQDIISRIESYAQSRGQNARIINPTLAIELSSRMESIKIPGALKRLERFPNNDVDALFATSMFATGVDVKRLGLMTVHGQPKTCANYIQATGRVGRSSGGIVITFYRSSRPRDLDHYEFFVGYHNQLLRYVEPITVYPFSPRAMERAIGPTGVAILRNSRPTIRWAPDGQAHKGPVLMSRERHSLEVVEVEDILLSRCRSQPKLIRPNPKQSTILVKSEIDRWRTYAQNYDNELVYVEYKLSRRPLEKPVVLGDLDHKAAGLGMVYELTPQSLRDVESTTRFG